MNSWRGISFVFLWSHTGKLVVCLLSELSAVTWPNPDLTCKAPLWGHSVHSKSPAGWHQRCKCICSTVFLSGYERSCLNRKKCILFLRPSVKNFLIQDKSLSLLSRCSPWELDRSGPGQGTRWSAQPGWAGQVLGWLVCRLASDSLPFTNRCPCSKWKRFERSPGV